jgi:hypothetical protein
LCETLGVQKGIRGLLEAGKDIEKCEFKNPENNKCCQLLQTNLFLPSDYSLKRIVWKRIEQTLLGYTLLTIVGRQKRICLQ